MRRSSTRRTRRGDRAVAARPVADREVGVSRLDVLGGELVEPAKPRLRVTAFALDVRDHLVDAHPLPGVEHLAEQRLPAVEVPVEAALGDAEGLGERLDPDGVGAAGGQGLQSLVDPAAAWCPGDWHRSLPYATVWKG